MGLLSWWRGSPKLTDGTFWSSYFGTSTWSGKSVTADTAMQLAAAFACVRLTAQAISTLPLATFERDGEGQRKQVFDTPLATVLQDTPNQDQTPCEFWESQVAWMCVNGNAYSEKIFIGGRLVSLVPMPSDQMAAYRDDNGDLRYRYVDRGKTITLPREKVFHLRGFSFGGDVAPSIIRYGAQTFSSAMATDESAAKMFANGLQSAGLLTSDTVMTVPQREQLRAAMTNFVGSTNAGKLMILEAGLKFQTLTLNPEDAQMLETRRFAIEEICRWFGIPPIIVGHAAQGQTMWGSGVEQILIAWLTLGLNPMMRRIEQRIRKELASVEERSRGAYAEFNREGLLQADSAAKATFLSTMTSNGLMTRNEGRSKLNLPKMPGGDELTVQMQMQPIGTVGKQTEKVPAP